MTPTLCDAMTDPAFFGRWLGGPSYAAWHTLAKVRDGLPLTTSERVWLGERTGGRQTFPAPGELWIAKGRRSGGSLFAAADAAHVACFGDFRGRLGPGEKPTVMLLAADRRQARVLMRYVVGLIEGSDLLRPLIVGRTAESIELRHGTVVEIHTRSRVSVRGYGLALAVCDEIAHWESDEFAASPDAEVLTALRPALASLGGRLVCVSSPYARRGAMWEMHTRYFGTEDARVLVVQGDTRAWNPTIDASVIDAAYAADPAAAAAEWGAQFRTDVETFVPREVVDACVVPGRTVLPPVAGVRYHAFADPSGGSSDSFTVAVAHTEGTRVVLDFVREARSPFDAEAVVASFVADLRRYHVTELCGDKYAGLWVAQAFGRHGLRYVPAEHTASELYVGLLPLLTSRGAELLDVTVLLRQLLALERSTSRQGRDVVTHPPRGHDDVINAASGALVTAHRALADARTLPIVVTSFSGRPLHRVFPDGRIEHVDRPVLPTSDFVHWSDPYADVLRGQRAAFERQLSARG